MRLAFMLSGVESHPGKGRNVSKRERMVSMCKEREVQLVNMEKGFVPRGVV